MGSILKVDNLQNSDGTRTLASDSGTAWSWGANAPSGMVIEQFYTPCDGSAITVQSGTYTVGNVSAAQEGTTSHADITGSTISYTPPTGTQTVIYNFDFQFCFTDSNVISHFSFFIDSDEVTYARFEIGCWDSDRIAGIYNFRWGINIGGSASTNTGRLASWTSAKTLKMTFREYSSSYEMKLHTTEHWDGGATNQFHIPRIGITALA